MAHKDRYVISPHRPLRGLWWALLLVLLSNAAQAWWHLHYNSQPRQQFVELQRQHQQTLAELHLLRKHQLEAQNSNSDQQQQLAMQTALTEELHQKLSQLQQRVIDLNKELVFYQTITQGNSSSELQLRELQLRADSSDPSLFRYRLVITQGQNISQPITGVIDVSLALADEQQMVAEHALNLRHVQVIEGTLNLSSTETPEQISFSLRQDDKTLLSQSFDWQPEI